MAAKKENGRDMIFNEENYLQKYSDVRSSVDKGEFKSGYDHYVMFGKKEGRTDSNEYSSRVKLIAEHLDLDNGVGLEIGPSHNPVFPKSSGINVEIIDHLDKNGLIEKYSTHQDVDTSKIEDVDYVWDGRPLAKVIGKLAYYDWIIASHVIEHTPCLIAFLQDCAELLKEGGVLSLVIPDKRYCFDHLNERTSIGDILDAHIMKRVRPTPGKIYEYLANSVKLNKKIAWSKQENYAKNGFELVHDVESARRLYFESIESDTYHDVHVWRFTPKSFEFIINELNGLGLVNLKIISIYDTVGCEFYASLAKRTDIISNDESNVRLNSLLNIKDEIP